MFAACAAAQKGHERGADLHSMSVMVLDEAWLHVVPTVTTGGGPLPSSRVPFQRLPQAQLAAAGLASITGELCTCTVARAGKHTVSLLLGWLLGSCCGCSAGTCTPAAACCCLLPVAGPVDPRLSNTQQRWSLKKMMKAVANFQSPAKHSPNLGKLNQTFKPLRNFQQTFTKLQLHVNGPD